MDTLTAFDLVVLLLIGFMALGGAMRGFVTEAIGLAAWVAAVVAVRLFHEPATGLIARAFDLTQGAGVTAFLLLFFGTLLLVGGVARTVGGATRNSLLGPIDRALGLGFGAVKGLIAASALFLLAQYATRLFSPSGTRPPAWFQDAATRPMLATTSAAMIELADDIDLPTLGPDKTGYREADRETMEGALDTADGPADGR